MTTTPRFNKGGIDRAREIVAWVDREFSHARLTPKSIMQLRVRTPAEIIESRKIMTAFGCLDKVAVITTILNQEKVNCWIVSERVYHDRKPIGIHFRVEAEDNGSRYTVDPHTTRTDFHQGWYNTGRQGELSQGFKGSKKIEYKTVNRKIVNDDAMKTSGFQLAGMKGRLDYLRQSQVTLPQYIQFVASRGGSRFNRRMKRLTERAAKR